METNEILLPDPPFGGPSYKLARLLFINSSLTIEQIACHCYKTVDTINTWRLAGKWDEERIAHTVSPWALVTRLSEEIDLIFNSCIDEDGKRKPLTPQATNAISKLIKCIKEARESTSPQVAMEVLFDFMNSLAQTQPDLAKQLAPLAENYVNDKMKP